MRFISRQENYVSGWTAGIKQCQIKLIARLMFTAISSANLSITTLSKAVSIFIDKFIQVEQPLFQPRPVNRNQGKQREKQHGKQPDFYSHRCKIDNSCEQCGISQHMKSGYNIAGCMIIGRLLLQVWLSNVKFTKIRFNEKRLVWVMLVGWSDIA